MIDYSRLERALDHLGRQLDNRTLSRDRPELSDLDRDAIDESVIHRFETAYDMLWKHLKRYLVEKLGLPDVPNSPKPLFRIAEENGLLPSSLDTWMTYAELRIGTAHDYSAVKAAQCLQAVPSFMHDAEKLFATISGKTT